MRRCLMICAACWTLTACGERLVYVTPDVPAELREPVPRPDTPVETLGDLAVRAIELEAALGTANGRLTAIDCILTAAARGTDTICQE